MDAPDTIRSHAAAATEGADSPFGEAALGRLREGLFLIAARRLGQAELAQDAAQEVVARVLSAIRDGRLSAPQQLGPFAYGVLRHVLVDMHRQAQREAPLPLHEPVLPVKDALETLVAEETMGRVRWALRLLSRRERTLLRQCFMDGLRVSEIARQTGEPEGRLRQRKLRALERLRAALGNRTATNTTD